jgi:hypothetical protein
VADVNDAWNIYVTADGAIIEDICIARDLDHPLADQSYCGLPPGHDGDHDFRYDAQD